MVSVPGLLHPYKRSSDHTTASPLLASVLYSLLTSVKPVTAGDPIGGDKFPVIGGVTWFEVFHTFHPTQYCFSLPKWALINTKLISLRGCVETLF